MVDYNKLPAASAFFDGQLYQTMNEDLQLAGMSNRTVHGRFGWEVVMRRRRNHSQYRFAAPLAVGRCEWLTSPTTRSCCQPSKTSPTSTADSHAWSDRHNREI
jgi:hypothetical protein